MNLETSLSKALAATDANAFDLAHCQPLRIGPVEVVPAMRCLRGPDDTVTMQPLAMRVLIALIGAEGRTCSRDDLVEACWNQRIVGDDAVHRIISTLRRDLAKVSRGAVAVETIPKVGYRLRIADADAAAQGHATTRPFAMRRPMRFWGLLAGAGALAAGAAFAAGLLEPAGADSFTIGVEPVRSSVGDDSAERFASEVSADLARFAGTVSRITLVDRTLASARSADLLVRVTVERDAAAMVARARVVEARSGSIILARDFRDEDGDVARLRDRTAVGLAGIMTCALERSAGAYQELSLRRLYFAACDALESEDGGRAEGLIRQLVAREPDVGAGWGCLAQLTLRSEAAGAAEKRALLAQARRYAERAIRLDPGSGRGYAALAFSWADGDPRALRTLERGLRADPEHVGLYSAYATSLFNGGYVNASVQPAQRALALSPASRFRYGSAVRRLLAAGHEEQALAIQDQAERLFPGSPDIRMHKIRLLPYWPDPAAALAEFERVSAEADMPSFASLTAIELRWRANPKSLDLSELDRTAEKEFADAPPAAWRNAALMTRLGQTERALAWLERAPRRETASQWSLLFWPEVAPLRRDPRFFAAMGELGLVDLWIERRQWPDFCNEPGLRYDCAAEARRLGYGAFT